MLYDTLMFYLQVNLPKPSLDFIWDDKYNDDFFNYLAIEFPSQNINDEKNSYLIKQVFKDYFENIGYLLFKLNDKNIKFKIFPYKTKPKDSVNLNSIINIIDNNKNLIQYKYNNKDDQILIKKDLVSYINNFTYKITNEEINKKELVKYAIRKALSLTQSDMVINKNYQIFIKLFTHKEISQKSKNTIAQRFNGIDEKKLKAFNDEYFSYHDNIKFFKHVAKTFVEIHLIKEKIDNDYYEKKVFSLIQSIILEKLINLFDYNENFFIGFSGYIFRLHFKEVFTYIADSILYELTSSNHIMEFLKYYSLNVVIIDSKKYKIPSLKADDGKQWNAISILSVTKMYIKTKRSIKNTISLFDNKEDKVYSYYINDLSPIEYNRQLKKDTREIEEEINICRHKLDIILEDMDALKSNEKKVFNMQEINYLRQTINELKKEMNELAEDKLSQDTIKEYSELQRSLDTLDKSYKRESKILEQNKEAYLSIKSALVKALISKKELFN